MSKNRSLMSFILIRFFVVLLIVSIVELVSVILTNTYLLPLLVEHTKYGQILKIGGIEELFSIFSVLVLTALANMILPLFRVSPVQVNEFLLKTFVKDSITGGNLKQSSETLLQIKQEPKLWIPLILTALLIAVILAIPYIVGGIAYSISTVREIKARERAKDEARIAEEKRRYLMISNIVHDLKTPMTTVYGYAKALNDGVVPDEKKPEYLEAVMSKSDRMNEVVAMLLDYVKLDSEGFTIKRARIDICELVRSCCAFCYTDIETASDELDVNIPEHPIYISADNLQLSRVVTNLIVNAIKHNPSGTKIKVSVTSESETEADDVKVFVADSGNAIEPSLAEHIFEPFFTGDESRSSSGGTGLGLPLSKRICEMHDFSLRLVQKPEILRYHLGDEYQKVFMISM